MKRTIIDKLERVLYIIMFICVSILVSAASLAITYEILIYYFEINR